MRYATLCSGIGAPEAAWSALGWECVMQSEIEPFPSAVLAAHYPDVPNRGDMTRWKEWNLERGTVDLVCGGTPCQSFSVAGKRGGLDDPRGWLAFEFCRFIDAVRPRWVVWENVPGVLSSGGGRDFGAFIGSLAELGYGLAYRVLDAQYFGVPQRRRRVFVVGYFGDWRRACAVLFEPESLCGDTAPRGKKREEVAGTLGARATAGGGLGTDFDLSGGVQVCGSVSSKWAKGTGGPAGDECYNLVAHALRGEGHDASEDGTGRGVPLVTGTLTKNYATHGGRTAGNNGGVVEGQIIAAPLTQSPYADNESRESNLVAGTMGGRSDSAGGWENAPESFVFEPRFARNGRGAPESVCPPLKAQSGRTGKGDAAPCVVQSGVRRLSVKECERLMGFPDGYTDIEYRGKPAADSPRYRALGNSMAVPVLRWIGERIQAVEEMT